METTFTKGHAYFCGAALLGMLTYLAFPYPIAVGVGAILGAMLVDADLNLPAPRIAAHYNVPETATEEPAAE